MDDLLGAHAQVVNAVSLQAQLASQAQAQADLIRDAWFGPGHELNVYALEDVKTLGRRVI